LDHFQTIVGVLISFLTAFIGWQTHTLSQRTEANNDRLKRIEEQLSANRFGFERMRDIYDRTEKYLSRSDQGEARCRILVVLINDIPDRDVRAELLAVVAEKAKLTAVAAKAADFQVGNISPHPAVPTLESKPFRSIPIAISFLPLKSSGLLIQQALFGKCRGVSLRTAFRSLAHFGQL
jgi:hypothetical protein